MMSYYKSYYKIGDRVRVIQVPPGSKKKIIKVGDEGTIMIVSILLLSHSHTEKWYKNVCIWHVWTCVCKGREKLEEK